MKITLQDVAFMKNLIMQSYRRKMIKYIVNLMGFVPFIIYLISRVFFDYALNFSISLPTFFLAMMCLINYLLYYAGDKGVKLPWVIKDEQLKVVKDHYDENAQFEELKHRLHLQEFFMN